MPNHDAVDNSSATLLAKDPSQHTASNITTPSAQQNTQATVPQSQNVIKSGIRRGATMPTPLRSATQMSFGSLFGFVKVDKDAGSAPNGDGPSELRQIFWHFFSGYTPTSGLRQEIIEDANRVFPPLASAAFSYGLPQEAKVPDFTPPIKIKSKRKKYGMAKWKEYIATIDTGCSSGNWVPVQILTELGITGDLLPLTKEEERGSQSASGEEVYARGAVELTWRGDPEEFPNSSKTFKNMRFLVSAVQNPPYDILIGKKSICEHKILFAPTLLGGRKIVELPPPASLPRGQPTNQRQTLAERQRINNLALAAQNMNSNSTLSNTGVQFPSHANVNGQQLNLPPTSAESSRSGFASVHSIQHQLTANIQAQQNQSQHNGIQGQPPRFNSQAPSQQQVIPAPPMQPQLAGFHRRSSLLNPKASQHQKVIGHQTQPQKAMDYSVQQIQLSQPGGTAQLSHYP